MFNRRFILGAVAGLPFLAVSSLAQAQVAADAAKSFIDQSGQKLVSVVNSSASTSEKADQLRQLVDQI
jgi:phospholipid transport system substrate-binding protein